MKQRRRTNTVAAAKRPDVWNPRKVWLIKHYADGHYSLNQEIAGRRYYPADQRTSRARLRELFAGEERKIP